MHIKSYFMAKKGFVAEVTFKPQFFSHKTLKMPTENKCQLKITGTLPWFGRQCSWGRGSWRLFSMGDKMCLT